jgi:hypothetical protein
MTSTFVYSCSLKVLSHGGDVPSSAIDAEVDLIYFPDAFREKDMGFRRVCIWSRLHARKLDALSTE